MKRQAIIGLLASALLTTTANAAVITMNDIDGKNPSQDDPYTIGMSVDANATTTGIGRGSGITGRSGDDRYNAKSWSTSGWDADDYFTFTMDANDGYEIDFTSFTYTGQASSQGPTSFELRSSLDNYSSTIGSPAKNAVWQQSLIDTLNVPPGTSVAQHSRVPWQGKTPILSQGARLHSLPLWRD